MQALPQQVSTPGSLNVLVTPEVVVDLKELHSVLEFVGTKIAPAALLFAT